MDDEEALDEELLGEEDEDSLEEEELEEASSLDEEEPSFDDWLSEEAPSLVLEASELWSDEEETIGCSLSQAAKAKAKILASPNKTLFLFIG